MQLCGTLTHRDILIFHIAYSIIWKILAADTSSFIKVWICFRALDNIMGYLIITLNIFGAACVYCGDKCRVQIATAIVGAAIRLGSYTPLTPPLEMCAMWTTAPFANKVFRVALVVAVASLCIRNEYNSGIVIWVEAGTHRDVHGRRRILDGLIAASIRRTIFWLSWLAPVSLIVVITGTCAGPSNASSALALQVEAAVQWVANGSATLHVGTYGNSFLWTSVGT